MALTLAGIELPEDLYWSDEFTAWKVGQVLRTSLTGALVVQEAARQAGRPVTLTSTQEGAYVGVVTLDTLNALRVLEESAGGASMPLVLPVDGGGTRSMQVRWHRASGPAIEARPIRFKAPAAGGDLFFITLRLIQV